MKIKYFSKRKWNVRISKTKTKCATLGFSQNCCVLGKSRKVFVNLRKIEQNSRKIARFFKQIRKKNVFLEGPFSSLGKKTAILNESFENRERCKGVHCVDLGESFPTHIFLKNLASIQPRTSPVKFARYSRYGRYSPGSSRARCPRPTTRWRSSPPRDRGQISRFSKTHFID